MALEDAGREIDAAFTRKGPRGLSYENAFAGATSFMRRNYTKDIKGFDLVVTGIPVDAFVTNRPGARFGPRAIRAASSLQPFDPPFGWDGLDPLGDLAIADYGDIAFDYARPGDIPERIKSHVSGILVDGPGVICLGGDHSVTLPILRAHAERHGPLALIQIDAHSDLWADDDAARIDHGTFTYKAVKEGLIDAAHSAQIGIRTVVSDTCGVAQFSARAVHEEGPSAIARRVKELVGDRPAYLTFDIDALDPAFAPGTGTPVWGGLSSGQAAILLRDLAGINLVGGDVVEVSPPYDAGEVTAVAGAHVAMEIVCLWHWNNLRKSR